MVSKRFVLQSMIFNLITKTRLRLQSYRHRMSQIPAAGSQLMPAKKVQSALDQLAWTKANSLSSQFYIIVRKISVAKEMSVTPLVRNRIQFPYNSSCQLLRFLHLLLKLATSKNEAAYPRSLCQALLKSSSSKTIRPIR